MMSETVSSSAESGVLDRIRYHPAGYNPVEARIASAVLEDPSSFARTPIIRLAGRLAVSTGSIVRFARLHGFTGFTELKIAVAEDLPATAERTRESLLPRSAMRQCMDEQVRALLLASSQIDELLVSRAARAIAMAPRVDIVATGASAAVAQSLLFALTIVGIHVRFLPDPSEQAAVAALLNHDDVLVAISSSGRTRAMVDAAARARQGGATVISLCCGPNSPLVSNSEMAITIDAGLAIRTTGEWPLRTALFAVSRVLAMEVVAQLPEREINERRARWSSGRFQLRYE